MLKASNALDVDMVDARQPDYKSKILIAVHQGFSIRYLLQTDIFQELRKGGADLVILSQSDPEHLRMKLMADDVVIEQIPDEVGARGLKKGIFQRAMCFVRSYTHGRSVKTADHTLRIAIEDAYKKDPSLRTRVNYHILKILIWLSRRSYFMRCFLLKIESRLYVPAEYVEVISRHKPDLVVTSSVGTFNYDQFILRAARKCGIASTAVILSWDNTTTRGYPGAVADHVIAWTDIMKWELSALNDIEESAISVKGVAHFDDYFRKDPDFDRDSFRRSLGLDPEKRTILVATKSPNCYAQNPNIVQILAEAIEKGEIPDNCQILVRVHPLHYRYRSGHLIYDNVLSVYRELAVRHACVHLNEPDIQSATVNYDMDRGEIIFLSRLLRSTDVLVNIFSTMNIEAAIFDVPMVNVAFDSIDPLYDTGSRGSRFDIRVDYESDHNCRIINSGGTQLAWTPDGLVAQVRAALADPDIGSEGRQQIVQQETGPNKGCAGKSIGEEILRQAIELNRVVRK